MAATASLQLQERVHLKNTLQRASDLITLFFLISLLCYRATSLHSHGFVWLVSFLCEFWFTFIWFIITSIKWSPVTYKTYPQNLLKKFDELPTVDVFVTTADPKLEPPIITVNTVLSLLAVEYPVEKLACYVSDDGASPATFYSLVQASNFAKLWVPFCKKYNVRVRAPSVYFSTEFSSSSSPDFIKDWKHAKDEYEKLCQRIENACQDVPKTDEFTDFSDIERGNHPSIVKIVWENRGNQEDGFPHLIYVSREKRPEHPHHFKAGAMNVLARVSAVMTNAPFMLNVDCDMFANNPEVVLHGMCLLFGFPHEIHSGYVQAPQQFHGGLRDDPFGNQLVVLQRKVGYGIAGLQGPFYAGTGCFHRRKVIYGSPPELPHNSKYDVLSCKEPQQVFGDSKELLDSVAHIMSGNIELRSANLIDLSSKIEAAKQVASCTYEFNTGWGKEVGWFSGSVTEDVQTGIRIQSMGWESKYLTLDPAPFLGNAPTGGPASLAQQKRWSTGLLEILVGPNSPLLATIHKSLTFRQFLVYVNLNVWALRSLFELSYTLLPPYCLLTNSSFLPKVGEAAMVIPVGLLLSYNVGTLMEFLECGLSVRAWWNNQRMQRIYALTSWLFGFIGVVLKMMGLSETIFEVTRKDQSFDEGDVDLRRFTFDSSPVFVPGTAVVLVNVMGLVVGLVRIMVNAGGDEKGGDGPGFGEFVCCVWVVLSFWPFVRGFFGKGSYGIPWVTVFKAAALVLVFLLMFVR